MRQLVQDSSPWAQHLGHPGSCLCLQCSRASRAGSYWSPGPLACLSCWKQMWRTHLEWLQRCFFFFLCFKGVSIEAVSENKMASSEFSSGPVEKAAKPLPFKDPNFVVSIEDAIQIQEWAAAPQLRCSWPWVGSGVPFSLSFIWWTDGMGLERPFQNSPEDRTWRVIFPMIVPLRFYWPSVWKEVWNR